MSTQVIFLYLASIISLSWGTTTIGTTTSHVPDSLSAATVVIRVPTGGTAALNCPLLGVSMLVWDREHVTGAIAIGGVVQAGRGPRYSIATSGNGAQTLNINDVRLDDNDVYRCYPFTAQSSADATKTNLTILAPPDNLQIRILTDPIEEGRPLHVSCTATSRPATEITWTLSTTGNDPHSLQGTVTDVWNANGTISRSSDVYLPGTRDLYGAVFTCSGQIPELSYSQNVMHTLSMNVPPQQPVLQPPSPTAVEGTRTYLTCTAPDARPPARTRWYWEGNPVNGDVQLRHHDNGTSDVINRLWVTPTERLNGVLFICEVNHDVLTATGVQPYRLVHALNVQYEPRVSVAETTLSVWEGSPLYVSCSFYGNPNVTDVMWYKNDVALLPGGRISMTRDNNQATLRLTASNKDDSGEYQCEAINSVGRTKSAAVLVLALHSPICDANQQTQFAAPIGQQVSLVCRVEALPSALVFFGWSINGSDWVITEGSHDPNVPTAAFSMYNYTVTSEESYGNVTCTAYNGVNEMSEPCVLRVREPGPAEAPSLCETSGESNDGATVDCRDGYDGGYPASYWLQWRDVGSDMYVTAANLTDYDFLVSGLSSGRMYPMRVCAANSVYWQNVSCTPDFMVATQGSGSAGSVSASSSSNSTGIIIGGAVGALLLVCLVAIIVEVTVLRKRDKKRMQEDAELYSSAYSNPGLEMRERHPRSPPEAVFRRSRDFTNIDDVINRDDPLYDSADNLRGKMSEERIKSLTRQGERVSIIESEGLRESAVDPEMYTLKTVAEEGTSKKMETEAMTETGADGSKDKETPLNVGEQTKNINTVLSDAGVHLSQNDEAVNTAAMTSIVGVVRPMIPDIVVQPPEY